jgi:hypothetical protein
MTRRKYTKEDKENAVKYINEHPDISRDVVSVALDIPVANLGASSN